MRKTEITEAMEADIVRRYTVLRHTINLINFAVPVGQKRIRAVLEKHGVALRRRPSLKEQVSGG